MKLAHVPRVPCVEHRVVAVNGVWLHVAEAGAGPPLILLGGHRPDDLDVAALLVMGEDSPIRRVLNPQPSRNRRVETIDAAGHLLPEEAPERVLELTLEDLTAG